MPEVSKSNPAATLPPELDPATTLPSEPDAIGLPTQPDPAATLPSRPEPEDDVATGASVRAITSFDIADTISQRALPSVDLAPDGVWEGGSVSVADVDPSNIDISADWDAGTGELKKSGLGPTMEEPPPPPPKAKYYTRPAEPLPTPQEVNRLRFLQFGAVSAVVGIVGWNVARRRPAPAPEMNLKPASLAPADFVTLRHALRALLGSDLAGDRAASMADLRYQRLGPGPSEQLAADLRLLDLASAGLLDGRRFTRLSLGEARDLLDGWAASPISARRRIRSELEHLARWCWAEHPATREELGRG